MGFWRKELVDFALDRATLEQIREQMEWIEREPSHPRPYYQLALLYRMQGKQEAALGLLLEAIGLDPGLADAHIALSEIYSIREDYRSAWRHARQAAAGGDSSALAMLERHGITETE